MVVSGGDDNALTISLLDTASEGGSTLSTISVPDAHAASVTAVKILERPPYQVEKGTEATSFVIASSGNDHRVKMWTVDVHLGGSEHISAQNVADQYSSVADISSLDVINGPQAKLLVCGVGMEMLSLDSQISGHLNRK